MPLGGDLVQQIKEYDKKSLAWLLASTLYQIRSPKYFEYHINKKEEITISKEIDFLKFGKFVESIFPKNFSIRRHYSPEEEKNLHSVFHREFSELFDPKSLEEIDRRSGMMTMNISLGIGGIGASLGDSEKLNLITKFQGSEFLIKKYQQNLGERGIDLFATTIFFKLLILLLRDDNRNRFFDDFFYESLYCFVKETCEGVLEINRIPSAIRSVRLSGNNISAYSIYHEYEASFDRNIENLKKSMFEQGGFSFPNFDNIDHLKQIFLSSKIVERYNPQSIDYFMLNLDFFAPYELWEIKDKKYKEMDESAKTDRKKIIQKHTKFIISNILINAATANYYLADAYGDDYINKMIWIINGAAHFYNESPSSFVKERVKIITFNYESLFERQLFNRLSVDNANSLLGNITAVYGKIFLKDNLGSHITDAIEDGLWQSIFLSDGDDYFIKSPNGLDWGGKYSKYKDVLGQLSNSMKWIGECDSEEKKQEMEADRIKMIEAFDKATDIYFLGFGFDLNNLYQIGLIDKNSKSLIKNNRRRKFYVTGGDAKILNTIKTVFGLEEHQVITASRLRNIDDPNFVKKDNSEEVAKKIPIQLTNHLYRLKSTDGNIEFVVSDKMLPEALDDFSA